MEVVLDIRLSERRIFPAVEMIKAGTRREEKLLTEQEVECNFTLRKMAYTMSQMEMVEGFYDLMRKNKNNQEFMERLPY